MGSIATLCIKGHGVNHRSNINYIQLIHIGIELCLSKAWALIIAIQDNALTSTAYTHEPLCGGVIVGLVRNVTSPYVDPCTLCPTL